MDVSVNSADKISIVVPCFNEENSIPIFFKKVTEITAGMAEAVFEYIFVDDGSDDGTLTIIRSLSEKNENVRYISFSRNFGKEAALLAGIEAAAGDYIAVMDADLQDPPELLPEMYRYISQEGFDCAAAYRITRKDEPVVRSLFAELFYWFINKISETKMKNGARDFRLMTRQTADAVLSLREYHRFSKGLFNWVGFSVKWIAYENMPRSAGSTKWSFWKLFLYSLDGIASFSVKPLALSSYLGVLFCFFSFVAIIVILIRALMFGDPVAGWPSLVTIILFVGGVQLFCTGILGQYLAKTYLEVKQRPIYIVKEKS